MKKLTKQLFKLLSIHSPSGKEWGVAKYLLPILKDTMDNVFFDSYGNLYAEKRYGTSPYTVLLNAHMDTVAHTQPIPKWRKNKTEIYNSAPDASALGGDDKCGIACHLAVIRMLNKGTVFNGTLKVLFTRQEEQGCIGAGQAVKLRPEWFEDIDVSIVVDRRGGDNIITGGWGDKYCHENYAQFWVDMAGLVGFKGDPQIGSLSDTTIFAEIGINGINLSAGYYEAHTKNEYIKINELKRTVEWVYTAFNHIEAYGKFPSFEYNDYDYGNKYYSGNGKSSYYMGGKKYNTISTACYCDYCSTLWDSWDMVEDEDGMQVCPDCVDAQTMAECEMCLVTKSVAEILEFRGHEICLKCLGDMEEEVI